MAHSEFSFPVPVLKVRERGGAYRAASADEIVQAAQRLLLERVREAPVFDAPGRVMDFLRVRMSGYEREVFAVMFLDAQHRLIEFVELFRGTLTQTSIYPREVVKEALARNAAAVILAHNHPSGVAEPSRADETLTRVLADALKLVDVRVLDHMVVGNPEVVSFAARGLL